MKRFLLVLTLALTACGGEPKKGTAREPAACPEPPDDWPNREDMLREIERGRDCAATRRELIAAMRVPHYRSVVRRLKHVHELRRYRLHNTKRFFNGYLWNSLYEFRPGLDDAAGTLQTLRPPAPAKRAHRRYLDRIRGLNRTASRIEQRLGKPAGLALLERLPQQAAAADRAHAHLLTAAARTRR